MQRTKKANTSLLWIRTRPFWCPLIILRAGPAPGCFPEDSACASNKAEPIQRVGSKILLSLYLLISASHGPLSGWIAEACWFKSRTADGSAQILSDLLYVCFPFLPVISEFSKAIKDPPLSAARSILFRLVLRKQRICCQPAKAGSFCRLFWTCSWQELVQV